MEWDGVLPIPLTTRLPLVVMTRNHKTIRGGAYVALGKLAALGVAA
jgi:hypothetical protein